MDFTEKTVKKETIYQGRILSLRNDEVELPDGKKAFREVIEHSGGVAIAALTEKNELLFVSQYRYPYESELLELPAGKLERGEDPEACGKRELLEETGAIAGEFTYLGKVYPTPAYCEEVITIYFAKDLTFGMQHLDEGEFLSVKKIPLAQAVEMVLKDEIKDAKTQIGVLKIYCMMKRENS